MKRYILISIILLLSASGLTDAVNLPEIGIDNILQNEQSAFKEGELIVRFADLDTTARLTEGLEIRGPLSRRAIRTMVSDRIVAGAVVDKEYENVASGLAVVKLPKDTSVVDAQTQFNKSANVLYAEPNYKFKLLVTPNDPGFPNMWAMNNTGQTGGTANADINAPEAWNVNTGNSEIVVAVLDTGVDYQHPDLADNIWVNTAELNGTANIDDDNNGYVDDIYGYDFAGAAAGDPDDSDNDPKDSYFHGTHVAGVIGAVGNNNQGITGVCWNARIMALKIFADDLYIQPEVFASDAVEAIRYAIDNGAKVINASWGGNYYSQSLYDTIEEAGQAGLLFVAAAGNDGTNNDSIPVYPASFDLDNIISVMSTDHNDQVSEFSNYGPSSVDIAEPGTDILSTSPTYETFAMLGLGIPADYATLSGTSSAAPHVSGACALIWSAYPVLPNSSVKNLLLQNVDATLTSPRLCLSGGRANLLQAVSQQITTETIGKILNTRDPNDPNNLYTSIQAAIDNAADGDVLIAQSGSTFNEVLTFKGKAITLRSGDIDNPQDPNVSPANTVISGILSNGSVIQFIDNEGPDTVLKGFTITGGNALYGGGISCDGSSPTISDCIIKNNTAKYYGAGIDCVSGSPIITNCTITANNTDGNFGIGGGINLEQSPALITNCTISNNFADNVGGAIACYLSDPIINNCLILNNAAIYLGGGIDLTESSPIIKNCTIMVDDPDASKDGGIFAFQKSSPVITNCILWGNGDDLYNCSATYSNIEDNDKGTGNIHVKPTFVTGPLGRYYLSQTVAGQLSNSSGLDAGAPDSNADLLTDAYTTRTDGVADANVIDLGFHYQALPAKMLQLTVTEYDARGRVVPPDQARGYVDPNSGQFRQFEVVQLKAYPNNGYRVREWTGTDDDSLRTTDNTITMLGDANIMIRFEAVPLYQLHTAVVGGNGTISPYHTRGQSYPEGTVVTLKALPEQSFIVDTWTGTDNDTLWSKDNTVTMTSNKEVTVMFRKPKSLYVPGQYQDIGSAIDAAYPHGDKIVVAAGTYSGIFDFQGKALTIASEHPDDPCTVAQTIIQAFGSPVFIFQTGEGLESVVDGFTIQGRGDTGSVAPPNTGGTGAPGVDALGGAISCLNGSSPTLAHLVIRDCVARGQDGEDASFVYPVPAAPEAALDPLDPLDPLPDFEAPAGDGNEPGQRGANGANGANGAVGTNGMTGLDGFPGGNAGSGYGGAMYFDADSSPVILNCTLINCQAIGGDGGFGGQGQNGQDGQDGQAGQNGGEGTGDATAGAGGNGGNAGNGGPGGNGGDGGNGGKGGDGGEALGGAIYYGPNCHPTIKFLKILSSSTRQGLGNYAGGGGDAGSGGAGGEAGAAGDGGDGEPAGEAGADGAAGVGGNGGNGGIGAPMGINGTRSWAGAIYFGENCEVDIFDAIISNNAATTLVPTYAYGGGSGGNGGDGGEGAGDADAGVGGIGGDGGAGGPGGNDPNNNTGPGLGGTGGTADGGDGLDGPLISEQAGKRYTTGYGGANYYDLGSIVKLDKCIISHNASRQLDATGYDGGAEYYTEGCEVTITNCELIDNHAGFDFDMDGTFGRGGAQYFDGFCNIEIYDSNYIDNSSAGDGGGIFCLSDCNLTIKNVSLIGNLSDGHYGSGGAIYGGGIFDYENITWYNGSNISIEDSYFGNNQAAFGGAMYWYGNEAEISISDSVISNNTAEHGGGLFFSSGTPTITNCSIISNKAQARYFLPEDPVYQNFYAFNDFDRPFGGGGGIFCWSSDALIENCFITSNFAAGSGGGVYFSGDPSFPKLTNCLVNRNSAILDGGGVVSYWFASPTISNCTIANNIADNPDDPGKGKGGGLSCSYESQTNLINSILWGNTAAKGKQIVIGSDKEPIYLDRPASLTVSYSDIQGDRNLDAVYIEPGRTLNWLDGNINSDPLFVESRFFLSQTAAGQAKNSPCLNVGSDSAAALGLDLFTTRSDGVGDAGKVDLGFHYPIGGDQYQLTIIVIGEHGTVTPRSGSFNKYTVVTLRAKPDTGYQVQWTGTDDDSSTALTNAVTMDSNKTVTVEFVQHAGKTVTVPGNYPTIQEALNNARNGDTIIVDPGTYYGGYSSIVLVISKSVLITSRSPDDSTCVASTIIDGYRTTNDYGNIGVYFTSNTNAKTILNGFTIQNCGGNWDDGGDGARDANHPDGYDGTPGQGAGILIEPGASPIIKNCVIVNNLVQGGNGGAGEDADDTANAGRGGWGGWARGAGVYCGVDSKPNFINCSFENNTVRGGAGGDGGNGSDTGEGNYGGNYSRSQAYNYPSDSLTQETVVGDLWRVWTWDFADTYGPMYGQPSLTSYLGDYRLYSGYGGAAYCDVRSKVTFDNCQIRGNRSYGAMSGVGGTLSGSDRNLDPLVAYELPSYGAGVYCASESAITFIECEFEENIASGVQAGADPNHRLDPYVGYGGGVSAEGSSEVIFVDCNFVENQADSGGGIYLKDTNVDIIDCNVVSNSALRGGGLTGVNCLINIFGSEIAYNRAENDPNDPNDENVLTAGAGMYFWTGGINIQDCNVAGNIANFSGGGIYLRSNGVSIFNSLFTNNAAGRDGGAISANWSATPIISNCTFVGNAAIGNIGQTNRTGYGGGLYCSSQTDCTVIDSIFWNNQGLKGTAIALGTGLEFDPRPSILNISYSDVKNGQSGVFVDNTCTLNWGEGNINSDPFFVSGRLGGYYLSQRRSGQSKDSPCVNAGSDFTHLTGLLGYTTRTDDVADRGRLDMGYHHPMTEPCRLCDLAFDGIINFQDFAMLAQKWLREGCNEAGGWCDGADITSDTFVNMSDIAFLANCWLVQDTTAPLPNPSRWKNEPNSISTSSIKMSAERSYDAWGWDVEYFFECVGGGCHDSGWRTDPNYTDTGLATDTIYGYRVRARDGVGNETEWSETRYAGKDNMPPAPAPHIMSIVAASETSITMIASTAYDDTGVQYYFESVTDGGHDSGWIDDPNYTDVGLSPNTEYGYRVKARDRSTRQNETEWSNTVYATTIIALDTTAPTPNPMTWDAAQDPNGFDGTPREVNNGNGIFDYWAQMTATIAVDGGGGPVEYYFQCTTQAGFSSGWQASNVYTVLVGRSGQGHRFRVKARDQFGNETGWSVIDVAD